MIKLTEWRELFVLVLPYLMNSKPIPMRVLVVMRLKIMKPVPYTEALLTVVY